MRKSPSQHLNWRSRSLAVSRIQKGQRLCDRMRALETLRRIPILHLFLLEIQCVWDWLTLLILRG